MKPLVNRFKKLFVIGMVTMGMAAGALFLGLWFYWMDHSPSAPRPTTGQTCPCNNHGYIFYVTGPQDVILDGLRFVFVAFSFGGALLNLSWKVVRNPYDELPKKRY